MRFRNSIFIAALLFVFIPAHNGAGQLETKHPIDSLEKKVDSVVLRVENANKKVDSLKAVITDVSQQKPDELQTWIKKLIEKKQEKSIVQKTVIKRVEVPTYRDTTVYMIEKQYVGRPIIMFEACRTYGGETKYLNLSQWLDSTGKKSGKQSLKEYRQYLKSLNN